MLHNSSVYLSLSLVCILLAVSTATIFRDGNDDSVKKTIYVYSPFSFLYILELIFLSPILFHQTQKPIQKRRQRQRHYSFFYNRTNPAMLQMLNYILYKLLLFAERAKAQNILFNDTTFHYVFAHYPLFSLLRAFNHHISFPWGWFHYIMAGLAFPF